jgi:hypothetical protein
MYHRQQPFVPTETLQFNPNDHPDLIQQPHHHHHHVHPHQQPPPPLLQHYGQLPSMLVHMNDPSSHIHSQQQQHHQQQQQQDYNSGVDTMNNRLPLHPMMTSVICSANQLLNTTTVSTPITPQQQQQLPPQVTTTVYQLDVVYDELERMLIEQVDMEEQDDVEMDEILAKVVALNTLHQNEITIMNQMFDEYVSQMHKQLVGLEKEDLKRQSKTNQQRLSRVSSGGSSSGSSSGNSGASSGGAANKHVKAEEPAVDDRGSPSSPNSDTPAHTWDRDTLEKMYSDKVNFVVKKKKNFTKDIIGLLDGYFFSHLHDPYPGDADKQILMQQTGLSLRQLNTWFGNKRMRYKRKMLKQQQQISNAGESQMDDDDDE